MRRRLAAALLATLAIAGVAAHAADAPAADQPLKALPYSPSLDISSMDPGADACVDFFRYACGGWIAKNPIPSDQSSWGVYPKLHHDNLRYLWGILVDAAEPRAGRSASEQKTGDHFAACMDESAIDAAGAKPLQPMLDRIAALRSVKELAPLLARLHHEGADNTIFRFGSQQDLGDSSHVIAGADAGGLGLPDRDQYLARDKRSRETLAAYRGHVARMLELLGDDAKTAKANAGRVIAVETELARASLRAEDRRDPRKLFHRQTLGSLKSLTPRFDWPAFLDAMQVPPSTPVNTDEPAFFRKMNALLATRSLDDWKAYLRWHLVNARAEYLSRPFAQADFDFFSARLRGVKAMPARWKRCVGWVDRDLGEALGEVFVKRTFASETRGRVEDMARAIESAMAQRIGELDWMTPETKAQALRKLHAVVNKIGYPDKWRDYSSLEMRRDDFAGNVARSAAFELKRRLAKIGKAVDRDEWDMTPPTVNAYYDGQLNAMNFPAGILQPPLFDPRTDDAPNFGNTGSTIGHELTHGFDDEGRRFDERGNLRDWWTKKDAREFDKRAACLVEQYGQYTAVDDIRVNGKLTLGENVADLGGTMLAYVAWKMVTANQKLAPVDGFTPDQRFFIGMAQWACGQTRPEALRLRAATDEHAPPRHRVNGVVANMPEFARAFSCKPGQPMVRPKPCKVW